MREYATPPSLPRPPTGNLTDAVVVNARDHPDAVVLSRRTRQGWTDVTARGFAAEVTAVAKGLVAAGVETGDRVALMSRTRYEWTLLDYAIWFAGAVTVPVYPTSSADQVGWILRDCGARSLVAEGAGHADRVATVRADTDLERTWTFDEGAVSELTRLGAPVADHELERRRTTATPADLATVIYTSGTTGPPKGCQLTHGNFLFELGVAVEELRELFTDDAATLLFLPLAHVFARIVQVGSLQSRTRLGHVTDVSRLSADLAEFRPTFLLAVPRVFEKVFTTASQQATADGRGRIFDRATEAAIAWSRAVDGAEQRGRRPPLRRRATRALFDHLVYRRLRAALGGRCRYAVSGGAPLGERLGHFYRGVGITVLEGYGLTETTAAVTVNTPEALKIGSVGRPLPGTAVRVDDDGELLVRGGQVFAGYWRRPEATAEVLGPDGWLHTGDVGEVDEEGFVRITGRKREILVTAGGKNVAPNALEDRVRAHPLVSQCLVVGDGQPYVAALVTIDPESFPSWARARGLRGPVAEHVENADLRGAVQDAIDDANRAVSQAEAIRRFAILPTDWTEEAGQLTPSLKLRRTAVMREFRDQIAALYR